MSFGIVEANFVSVVIESILFGFFSMLFALSSYLLFCKETVSRPLRTRFACALLVMYILAITHEAINFKRALDGFTTSSDGAEYFSINQGGIDICKLIVYALQSLLGDVLMIYRLGIIYRGYRRVLISSLILMTGSFASGIVMLVGFSKQRVVSPFASATSYLWMFAFFFFSFIINLGGTITITIRIWLTRRMAARPMTELSPFTVVLLDPGIIYSASLICLFGVFLAKNYAVLLLLDWIPQIIGIVASLVIVRIGFKSLWNGRLDFTPRRDDRERPPMVPPKDDVWLAALEKGGVESSPTIGPP
ncbi:hypothetical protein ACEPAI_4100 [Sanghuangporus weigelae]